MPHHTTDDDLPLVSVIVPAYNCERFLARAITSVLSQNYPKLECIVIDDGSTDGTPNIINSFGDQIRSIKQPNQGAAAARNTGIAAAQGRYIAFLDADDYWLETKTINQIRALLQFPEVVLICSSFEWKSSEEAYDSPKFDGPTYDPGRLTVYRDLERLLQDPYLGTPSVIVKSDALRDIGGFDASLPIAEDVDMYFRICRGRSYAKLDQNLACFQHRFESLTKQLTGYRDNLRVLDNLEKRMPEIANQYRRLVDDRRREIYTWWVKDLLFRGKGRLAREVLRQSHKIGRLPDYNKFFLKSFITPLVSSCRTSRHRSPGDRE